ncbi:MAG: ribonuclease P protein subunit [Candidatus ainarchaeum sp.]|nr:ribonuclease P protein subunit [Candidatus ainarchaeum sp.]
MIDRKNLLFSTFIGLDVEISNSSQRKLVGLKGKVVDETKNLLIIEAHGKDVRVPKVSATFRFTLDDGDKLDVDGSKITFRPHERAKKV